ncbi:glycosyltransferase family 2 protein [Polynucleobacter paneuropaeus]|uniref:Glycosyltransferase n=1 Tax=Polynucleobacter paneuropaeus TaxID=2527775 RepID=A0A2Z4JQR8_9BURK|nr:glycosyltransferase family 2 protein [Polynucleobacter paneuropaeus]AWW49205.1 glycosyltransferase [Polynucleobacter paneuropaeus]
MNNSKISIITVVYNREDLIAQAVMSVQSQDYPFIEHVIIDGASNDRTVQVIKSLIRDEDILVSEPDKGIYDALNKGIRYSSGGVIGVLHSDDFFADQSVISEVVKIFENPSVDIVYGDLDYVSKSDSTKTIRHWIAGQFSKDKLSWGWMPPHPTIFIRRSVIDDYGTYDTSYRISGDYDAILRYFSRGDIQSAYIERVLIKMRVGGQSNRSLNHLLIKMREDYRALRCYKVGGICALFWKSLSKAHQFF